MHNTSRSRRFTSWFPPTAWRSKLARVKPAAVCASALAMLPVAVATMIAHYALRRRKLVLLSKVCVGHARLSSDCIANAVVVKLAATKNTTLLENADDSLGVETSSRESVGHAQLRLVVARSVLSAKGLAKT